MNLIPEHLTEEMYNIECKKNLERWAAMVRAGHNID
jgi:hypothetical protein